MGKRWRCLRLSLLTGGSGYGSELGTLIAAPKIAEQCDLALAALCCHSVV